MPARTASRVARARTSAGARSTGARVPVAVCLAGLSPAVVTESLYGLAMRQPDPVVPVEVHIVTTHGGYPAVVGTLLGPQGALARLRAQYRLPHGALSCTPPDVHVLTDVAGHPLDDIRTARDSRAAGELIGGVIRRLASDDGLQLHCSLAGGRKTMSALLATALQLHGRPGDRLYHVLINEPFERIPEFFFPPRPPARYRLDGRAVDSRRARIELVEVPFVRLGAAARLLGYQGLQLERIAAELEAEALGRLVPEPLTGDVPSREVRIGEHAVHFSPQEVALYGFYARVRAACRRRACRAGGRCPRCHLTDDEIHERRADVLALYKEARPTGEGKLAGLLGGSEHDAEQLEDFRDWIEQTRSRMNRALEAALGPGPRGRRYLVTAMEASGEGRRRRGLLLAPSFIRVDARGTAP